jgi:F-type H+-transporting ATPase subunit gamma
MSLYSKLDKDRLAIEYHKDTLVSIFNTIYKKCPKWKNRMFMPKDILDASPLFIIISATKGFCGGMNNILFRYIEQKLFIEEHQKPTFLTIGKKATGFVEDKKLGEIVATYHDLNSNNFSDIAKNLVKHISETKPNYSSVTVYSAYFKNFFAQKPEKTVLVPLLEEKEKEKEEEEEKEAVQNNEFNDFLELEPIWEQNKFEIVDYVAQRTLETLATSVLFQALVSEYAARFVAMDNATTNAENYLETMTLQFNKLRQALITREVSELSANL